MYNVQFGEAILLHESDRNLLVDFGGKDSRCLRRSVKDIALHFSSQPTDILITHFHEDHINGFWKTDILSNATGSTVYMPNLFSGFRTMPGLSWAQLHIVKDILNSIILRKRNTTNPSFYSKIPGKGKSAFDITLYHFFRALLSDKRCITFLEAGDSFYFSRKKYDVLWPDFNQLNTCAIDDANLIRTLRSIGIFSPNQFDGSSPLHLSAIDTFIDVLQNIAYNLSNVTDNHSTQINREILSTQLDNAYVTLVVELESLIRPQLIQLTNHDISNISASLHSLIRLNNDISIVFHSSKDSVPSVERPILMTGDISSQIFENIIDVHKLYRIAYRAIKIPHHGTISSFASMLPHAKYYLISNGSGHSSADLISIKYTSIPGNFFPYKLLCTNARCQKINTSPYTPCTNCTALSKLPYIDCP